jgi:Glutathione peroxidase
MGIRDIELTTIDGAPASMADYADKVVMVVNVASKCGLTPQYEKLESCRSSTRIVDSPCSDSLQPVPGPGARLDEEIKEFCSTTYGVTFPLMDKIKVNGRGKHPSTRS